MDLLAEAEEFVVISPSFEKVDETIVKVSPLFEALRLAKRLPARRRRDAVVFCMQLYIMDLPNDKRFKLWTVDFGIRKVLDMLSGTALVKATKILEMLSIPVCDGELVMMAQEFTRKTTQWLVIPNDLDKSHCAPALDYYL